MTVMSDKRDLIVPLSGVLQMTEQDLVDRSLTRLGSRFKTLIK